MGCSGPPPPPLPPPPLVFSRGGSLLGSSYADARYIDAVIVVSKAIAAKVDAYAAWVADDSRVGGVNPWHLDDRPWMANDGGLSPLYVLGAKSLPKTLSRLKALGETLLQEHPPHHPPPTTTIERGPI